MVVGHLGFA